MGQGTGLGLAVVHGVMRTHEGGIDVQSVPGQGQPVHAVLSGRYRSKPHQTTRRLPPPPRLPRLPAAAPTATRQKPHVMYVDDDQALVFLVQRLLRRRGLRRERFHRPP